MPRKNTPRKRRHRVSSSSAFSTVLKQSYSWLGMCWIPRFWRCGKHTKIPPEKRDTHERAAFIRHSSRPQVPRKLQGSSTNERGLDIHCDHRCRENSSVRLLQEQASSHDRDREKTTNRTNSPRPKIMGSTDGRGHFASALLRASSRTERCCQYRSPQACIRSQSNGMFPLSAELYVSARTTNKYHPTRTQYSQNPPCTTSAEPVAAAWIFSSSS